MDVSELCSTTSTHPWPYGWGCFFDQLAQPTPWTIEPSPKIPKPLPNIRFGAGLVADTATNQSPKTLDTQGFETAWTILD